MTNDFREKTRAAAAFALCLLLTSCGTRQTDEKQEIAKTREATAEYMQISERDSAANKKPMEDEITGRDSLPVSENDAALEPEPKDLVQESLGFWEKPCTTEETETQLEKLLYDNDEDQENAKLLRRMTLQKDSGMLEIWDYRYDRSIYSGKAALKEDGSLANAEYYDYLFADSLYGYYHSESDSAISNRETFLADNGFAGQEPFYCFYDRIGNLQLELWLNEETDRGCGLLHSHMDTAQWEDRNLMYGFAFDTVSDGTWTPNDPYQLTTPFGDTGKESVEEYEEIADYREDGKLDAYQSLGIDKFLCEEMEMPPDEKIWLIRINYIYRDDGSLFYRDYAHNSRKFFTSGQSRDSYYDELERPVYETEYITHGTLQYYYIYDDEGREPAYTLLLDQDSGNVVPVFERYH